MILRPYQEQALAECEMAWQLGLRNVLLVLPTGAGKTGTFTMAIKRKGVPSMAIAHRHELVGQISLALAKVGVRHGLIASKSTVAAIGRTHMDELGRCWLDPAASCKVASVDTLIRLDPATPMLQRIQLWVTDEAHHVALPGGEPNKWAKAISMMPNAIGLGVTATPKRADGLGLGRHSDGLFDHMVVGPGMRDLIEMGFLTDYEIFAPETKDLDLSKVPIGASGDFSPEPLRKAIHSSTIVGDIVATYLKRCAGKRGLTFCVDIEAATEQRDAFRAAGVPAEVISGHTGEVERSAALRKLRNGEILQVTNVDLVGEGFDLPALECVSFGRATASFALYAQQFGRVLRLMDGKRVGTVLDHVGNVVRHGGPPDMPRRWSLDRRDRRASSGGGDGVPMRVCPECTRPYERVLPGCPYCGHEPVPAGRSSPEVVEGDLTLLDPEVFRRMWAQVDAGPRFPHGATLPVIGKLKRDWQNKNEAQAKLREVMANWGGVRLAAGDTDRVMQRRFFAEFGVDVLSARLLNAVDAEKLTMRILP